MVDDEIVKAWLRFSFNALLLLILLLVTNVSLTSAISTISFGIKSGIGILQVINLVLFLITFFIGVRVVLDGVKIFDFLTSYVLRRIVKKNETGKIKKLAIEFIILFMVSLLSNSLIPVVQGWEEKIAIAISFLTLVFVILLAYDTSKTIYLLLEVPIHEIAEKITELKRKENN